VAAFVTAGAGFLLAVLWFDLMFDVQLLGRGSRDPAVVASIADYYRRVTTTARPLTWLIALVMVATLAALVVELAGSHAPAWVAWASLALAGAAIGTALFATVPRAIRLGARTDTPVVQVRLARAILREHLACFAAIAAVIALQLGWAA
jgi:ER membrane protein SH3